jgi:hypothetical protein
MLTQSAVDSSQAHADDNTRALERELLRMYFSRRDFRKASQFISAAIACDNNVVREALLISALISYTRPFGQSTFHDLSAGDHILNSLIPADAGDARMGLHTRILALRKRVVNESATDADPIELDASLRGISARLLFTPQRSCSGNWTILKEDLDLVGFGQLSHTLLQQCSERLLTLSDQLAEAHLPFLSQDPRPLGSEEACAANARRHSGEQTQATGAWSPMVP